MCPLKWPKFDLHFLILSLTRKSVSFGQIMDLAKDLAWKKIFSGRLTNLKIEKSRFFCVFATLIPYFISFPDTQWAYKIITKY